MSIDAAIVAIPGLLLDLLNVFFVIASCRSESHISEIILVPLFFYVASAVILGLGANSWGTFGKAFAAGFLVHLFAVGFFPVFCDLLIWSSRRKQ